MFFSNKASHKKLHLIIGGGYISQYHIRASLSCNFRIKVIELEKLKRNYLQYLFPEIELYSNLNNYLSLYKKEKIDLLSILIPIKFRENLYRELPDFNCRVIIEKPITTECVKKFIGQESFMCLNQAYNSSGILLSKNHYLKNKINKVISIRPDPRNLLRQDKYEEYLLDYLPHTLTPLHLVSFSEEPKININTLNKNVLKGTFTTKLCNKEFEVRLDNRVPDTYIYSVHSTYSYDNGLIKINSPLYKYKKNFNKAKSIIYNEWGYSTIYNFYRDINNFLPNNNNCKLIDKLRISNCAYLAQENYV